MLIFFKKRNIENLAKRLDSEILSNRKKLESLQDIPFKAYLADQLMKELVTLENDRNELHSQFFKVFGHYPNQKINNDKKPRRMN